MATRLWKCFPCDAPKGFDFEGDKPVCPKCGLDGDHPKAGGAIAPRVVIHYDPPGDHPAYAQNVMACQPKEPVGTGGTLATGDPREVTCPACKATPEHRAAMELAGTPMKYRVPAFTPPAPAEPEPA